MQKDLLRFEPVTSRSKAAIEILTDVAEKASWDPANNGQKHGLVWENRKKLSKINDDYLYLLFSLLFILCSLWSLYTPSPQPCVQRHRSQRQATQHDLLPRLFTGLTRAGKAGHKYIVPAGWQA
jgi:hypothetical protein